MSSKTDPARVTPQPGASSRARENRMKELGLPPATRTTTPYYGVHGKLARKHPDRDPNMEDLVNIGAHPFYPVLRALGPCLLETGSLRISDVNPRGPLTFHLSIPLDQGTGTVLKPWDLTQKVMALAREYDPACPSTVHVSEAPDEPSHTLLMGQETAPFLKMEVWTEAKDRKARVDVTFDLDPQDKKSPELAAFVPWVEKLRDLLYPPATPATTPSAAKAAKTPKTTAKKAPKAPKAPEPAPKAPKAPEPAPEPGTNREPGVVSCDVPFAALHPNEQKVLRWWCREPREEEPKCDVTPWDIVQEMKPTDQFVPVLDVSHLKGEECAPLRFCPRVWPGLSVEVATGPGNLGKPAFELVHPETFEVSHVVLHITASEAWFEWICLDHDLRLPASRVIRAYAAADCWNLMDPAYRRAWLNVAAHFYFGDALPDHEATVEKQRACDDTLTAFRDRVNRLG